MSESNSDSVAIVGFSFRLPGGANTPEKLWEILAGGKQCWTDVPEDRYNWQAFYNNDAEARGTHNARGGFFLDQDVSNFDAQFFGISATEAAAIDPQQRILLEVSYEALENAGMPIEGLRGSQTGVYVALVSRDYDRQMYKDPSQIPRHHLTGCGDATACGRISYVFDFKGPSMSIDTGCSGGMVGVHLACQALLLGETKMSLVGGTNLLLGPDMTMAMSNLHMINDNGRCYPFDSRGAGYGRAEGVAVMILKKLSDAIRDGDDIRAIIRGSGVGQDGKTNGILLPNSKAQQQLAESLYENTGIDPQEVGYVEAHGTGTQAGDAAEITSIKEVFSGNHLRRKYPLFVGSIKANLGHSESTSGLAGIIKAVLCLEKSLIPPIAELLNLKDDVAKVIQSNNIMIPQRLQEWPHMGVRRASVNSFGFGGTNAHVILESAPEMSNRMNGFSQCRQDLGALGIKSLLRIENNKPELFVISAKSKSSLVQTTTNLKAWIESHSPTPEQLHNLAKTLNTRRSVFNWRSSFVGSSNVGTTLSALGRARMSKGSVTPNVIFLFTGQGAQYATMGRELLAVDTAFVVSLLKSQCILKDLGAFWNLLDELQASESISRINSSEISQPATTAIQIALIDLLTDLNVLPAAVIGHSSGEVAAAYACGALTREDALKISYYKGFVSSWCKEAIREKGAMLAVGLCEAEVARYLEEIESDRASIACVNSPSSVTISGDELAILELKTLLDRNSVFNRVLNVDIAYHSKHMYAVSGRFEYCISSLKISAPRPQIKFFSSVSASQHESDITHDYWVDNLVSKVRFSEALELLVEKYRATGSEPLSFVEIGPHAALKGPIRQTMIALKSEYPKWSYSSTLTRGHDSHVAILGTIGSLFEQGVHLDLRKLDSMYSGEPYASFKPVRDLPPYAWDSNRFWHESRLSREYRFRRHAPHDLLGLRMTGTTTLEPIFRHILSVDDLPWLQEHIIDGFALYPGSAFLVQAIQGLKQISQDRGESRKIVRYALRDVNFLKALIVPESPANVEVLLSFKSSSVSKERLGLVWQEFRVSSQSQDGTWNEHCNGLIRAIYTLEKGMGADEAEYEKGSSLLKDRFVQAEQNCDVEIPSAKLYEDLRRNGVDYGKDFSIIKSLRMGEYRAVGTVEIPDIQQCMPSGRVQPHVIHPAVFDAFMHIALPLYHRRCSKGPVMLTSIGEVTISADILKRPGDHFVVECNLIQAKQRFGAVNVSIYQSDDQGRMSEVGNLTREEFRSIGEGYQEDNTIEIDALSCYKIEWIPIDRMKILPQWTNLERVKACSLTDSDFTQNLVLELASYLSSRCESMAVPCDSEHMDPESIHVVIDDGVTGNANSKITALHNTCIDALSVRPKSIIWITMAASSNTESNQLSTHIIARRAQQQQIGVKLITLSYQDMPMNKDTINGLVEELIQRCFVSNDEVVSLETDYAYEQGVLMVPKMKLHAPSNRSLCTSQHDSKEESADFHTDGRALKLDFKIHGLLTSARFVENSEAQIPLAFDEVDVRVHALAVNQSDVSIFLGRGEPTETMFGEFSGLVIAAKTNVGAGYIQGDRVCGWGPIVPYANTVRIKTCLLQRLGDSVSYEEGASIPLAFQTAYHALLDVAQLEKSKKLLIHGASGGVGQAAISIAQYIGAEVYATVGNEERIQLLTKTVDLAPERVFSSRSAAFTRDITRLTNGSGVDVVLNCCSPDLTDASLSCLAEFGVLINLVKSSADTTSPNLRRNVSIVSVDMMVMKDKFAEKLGCKFAKVMTLYNTGVLRPITLMKLPISNLIDAFKIVNGQKYVGKVVLTAEEGMCVKQTVPTLGIPKLDPNQTYVVFGGSNDLNLGLCVFLADRGAANIFSISFTHAVKTPGSNQSHEMRNRNVNLIRIEVRDSDPLSIWASMVERLGELPSVKGVIYVENSFQHGMDKKFLDKTLFKSVLIGESFDFYIQLRPITASPSCEKLAWLKNGKQSVESANLDARSIARSVTLRIPQIEDRESFETSKNKPRNPRIQFAELYVLLDFCMSTEANRHEPLELFIPGRENLSISPIQSVFDWNDPLFNTISRTLKVAQTKVNGQQMGSLEGKLMQAKGETDVYKIVADAVREQLSTFCALDCDDMRMSTAIADMGLDSLLAIEFKNWIVRTMHAPMQTTEILDARSLHELVILITKRSKLVVETPDPSGSLIHGHDENQVSGRQCGEIPVVASSKLQPLPIPDLHSLIERHLSYVKAFATNQEFENTLRLADEFETPGSTGFQLYQRLKAMQESDPENWYHDLYLRSQYLVRKGALAPYMLFFFTHPLSLTQHSQAERAALIASILIRYKRDLDNDNIQPKYVNEQQICMNLYKNLFNTCRQPQTELDLFNNHPGNDFFVVLRRGHAYKIDFSQLDNSDARNALRETMESILQSSEEQVDWFGVLTADHRVSWAKNYHTFLGISPANSEYIATIEKSAFLICLDDGAPETAEQRARQVHFSNGSNRWFDKSIQYVVCANGISGIVADHTGLDAATVQDINLSIAAAIRDYDFRDFYKDNSQVTFTEIKYTSSTDIETEIQVMRAKYHERIAGQRHFFPTPIAYGAAFMKSQRVPPNSGFQLVVQLAARYFFGYSPACWETVLQSTFRKGRVEINQIVTEKVAKFVTAAVEDTMPLSTCRKLFIDAALAHSSTVLACTRAGGSDRFLCMIREIVEEGEEEPALYHDPVYKRSRPRKMMSSCFKTHMAENGCVMRDEDAVWLHFEMDLDSVKFCGLGSKDQTQRFSSDLRKAAEKVRVILQS